MVRIRETERSDVEAILEISNWAAINTPANFAAEPEPLESWQSAFDQTRRMYPWLVAVDDDDRVMGFAKASPHRSRCAYAWSAEVSVYIDPAHHGRGMGTALYKRLIPILQAQGYITLIAGITTPNPASEKLHGAFGFKPIGAFERIGWKFNRWHDVGYYQVMLREGNEAPAPLRPVCDVIKQYVLQSHVTSVP